MTNTKQKYPPVIVVDDNDNEIGSAMLAEVWQKGLYHRVVSVFIQDDQGRMLLQLRSPSVGIYPNCWDQAVGGHVDEGQTYEQTAHKEAEEELGLVNLSLQHLGTFQLNKTLDDGRIINQFERVYLARVSHDVELKPDPGEVGKLQWLSAPELRQQVATQPEMFTPGLRHALRQYFPSFS